MAYSKLKTFLESEMKMQGVYQAVMIETILRNGGRASDDQIVMALLATPECRNKSKKWLLRFLNQQTKRKPETVGQVLDRHGIVERVGEGYALIGFDTLSSEQVAELVQICSKQLEEYRSRVAARKSRAKSPTNASRP